MIPAPNLASITLRPPLDATPAPPIEIAADSALAALVLAIERLPIEREHLTGGDLAAVLRPMYFALDCLRVVVADLQAARDELAS